MGSPLIATKLYVPRPRRGLVDRGRLTSRLRVTGHAKLTLVSAPAGFGKTTAVTSWVAASVAEDRVVAWVSLEEGDAQAGTFWTYVVAALHQAIPDVGADLLATLESGQPPATQLIATLVNEIGAQAVDIDLVLDDYHRADGSEVSEGMAFLLDHLPPNLHVVITTRADPDLPLARLRARGELVEIRARDLRFTEEETAAYVTEVGGVDIERADVATLTDRTEGWAAALQLATLSLQGRDDVTAFVAGFAGDDRYVVDYLADEVLGRQSQEVREFLLRTSVLERLSGDLCDAVTGSADGRARLDALDRANLFMVALDDRRHWYRYHHLFADVLRAHLETDLPGEAAELHRRASAWYAEAEETVPAVRHALAAGDVDRAADLVEAAVPALGRERGEATLRTWVSAFPDDVVRRRPVLALGLVGGLMQFHDFDRAQDLLSQVERWLPAIRDRLGLPPEPASDHDDTPDAAELVFVHLGALERVPATVEMYRAALALVRGEPRHTIEHAARAQLMAVPSDHLARGAGAALSGLACWTLGDLEEAHEHYSQSVVHLLAAGHEADVLGCTITLADLRIEQGRLTDASTSYDQGLRLAYSRGEGAAPVRGARDMHTGVAEIALERGDLDTARRHLLLAQELSESLGLGQNAYRLKATSAILAEAEGDLTTARELLVEAQAVYFGDLSPDVRPLHSRIARIDAALGDLAAAEIWARSHGLSIDAQPSYFREHEFLTWAEVLLLKHRTTNDRAVLDRARVLLDRLLELASAGGRQAHVLDVLALQALAAEAADDGDAADAILGRAIELGRPERHVRTIARHGAPMLAILDRAADIAPDYQADLRSAIGRPAAPSGHETSSTTVRTSGRATDLVEPLSPRELEVLRLLASDLDGPDIARHLVVSVNTLRTHTKNIYAKLGVTSRRAALRRAHELGLPLSG